MRTYLLIIFFIFSYTFAFSQNIKGVVIDRNTKEPLIGVNVIISNTNGTTTDFDGNFSISVNSGETLSIAYVGYQTQNQLINQTTNLLIELFSENKLDEVVVVGYGTQKRSNLVGAVATIEVDKASQTPTTNVTELLRGRAAGVQVNLGDARPGGNSSIVIRETFLLLEAITL